MGKVLANLIKQLVHFWPDKRPKFKEVMRILTKVKNNIEKKCKDGEKKRGKNRV